MSVVIVHADPLCGDCIHLGVWESDEHTGGNRKAVEMNDLCSVCAQTPGIVFDQVWEEKSPTLHKMVVSHSKWHKQLPWKQRWFRLCWWWEDFKEGFNRWNHYKTPLFSFKEKEPVSKDAPANQHRWWRNLP